MRLLPKERNVIAELVRSYFGSDARVWLFGSRVDDAARGGDIDLYIETPEAVDNLALARARFLVALQRALGERKIDVVIQTPAGPKLPIHRIARNTGVRLDL